MYTSNEFKEAWNKWKEHFREVTGRGYGKVAEEQAQSSLFWKSHAVEQLAIDSINWSIEKNWAAIYIKTKQDGHGQNHGGSKSATGSTGKSKGDSTIQAYREW